MNVCIAYRTADSQANAAFNRVDLLAVVSIVVLLAALLTPALALTRVNDQSFLCRNNLRQLLNCWRMYVEDNSDKVPSAWANPGDWWPVPSMSWQGSPVADGGNPYNWNVDLTLKKSPLYPYCGKTPSIWRCPADPSTAIPPSGPSQGQLVPRVRSISMLSWFNAADADSFGPGYVKYKKFSDVLNPGPARTFVFSDERCDSINDGELFVAMFGFPIQADKWTMVDFPGIYHNGGAGIAFADGHSEIHAWKDPRTTLPIGQLGGLNVLSTNNPDVYWLMDHSTRKP
jgi:prepilin-type processing-associated H-X9-DG protein